MPARASAPTSFSTLGVAPMIGRTFTAQEDLPNGPRLVVLGYGLWNRRYSADASLIGRSVLINGNAFEVVGVMPPGFVLPTDFRNPEPSQLWTPLQMDPADTNHGSHGLYAAGRLKPGATVRTGGRRAARHRARDDERRALPGPDAVRHGRALADRRGRRFGPPLDLVALRCGRVPAAHRLRERRQPAARARGSAPARDGRACGARRRAAARVLRQLLTESLVLDAAPAPSSAWAWRTPPCASWRGGTRPTSRASAGSTLDIVRPDLHGRRGALHERALQPRAGDARDADRSDRLAQGRRAERLERRRAASASATGSSSCRWRWPSCCSSAPA